MNNKLFGAFLALMGVVVLPSSALDLQKAVSNPNPTAISFDSFAGDLPEEGYFKLRGGQLEMGEALYVDKSGEVGNIYIPVRKAGAEMGATAPVTVLARVADDKSRRFVESMRKIDDKNQAQTLQFLANHQSQLQVKREITGTLASGLDSLDDAEKSALQNADANLSRNVVILQEGTTPSLVGRVWMLVFSLGLTIGGAVMIFKKA